MRIAVAGSGVAGLGAAYVLSGAHEVHVFERDERAGGHANTVVRDGLSLDTGFLVHNARNYPLLGRLFGELGVQTHESDMSFSVACAGCGLEYSGKRPFAQRANAVGAARHMGVQPDVHDPRGFFALCIEDMQDHAHQKRVTGLLPVIAAFECSFRVN